MSSTSNPYQNNQPHGLMTLVGVAVIAVKCGLVAICTGFYMTVAAQSTTNAASDEPATNHSVRVAPLSDLIRRIEHSAPAHVLSLNHARVAAQISARLTDIRVQVGNTVRAGDVLATLDCSDYDRATVEVSARLDAHESRRKLANQQLQRARRLAKSKAVSEDVLNQRQAEFDVAIADIAAQRAQLARAQTTASRCQVLAPFNGVAVSRAGQVGEYTTPGAVIVTLVDTINIELSAQIADHDVPTLTQAANVHFHYANETFEVNARTVLPVIDNLTRSREARFTFSSQRPSVGANGRLVWSDGGNALPANLISTHKNQMGIFVVNDNKAQFIALPDALEGRPVVIDLPLTTAVITEGRRILNDGDAIVVVD